MSFNDVLNEYRRRAGVPMKEQLRDPESEGWMENERDKAAVDPTRQYVDKISQMFRAIHDAAEQGYKETGHDGFAQILRAMGVMQESITEQFQSREQQGETSIELEHEETGEYAEVPLIVRFDVEPTEYEGGHLFYQGGVQVNSVLLGDNVMFGGMQVKKGDWFPREWMEHVGEHHFYGDRTSNEGIESYFYRKIGEKLAQEGDIHVPTQRYPRTQ